MESSEIISPSRAAARAIAVADFPEAVGPARNQQFWRRCEENSIEFDNSEKPNDRADRLCVASDHKIELPKFL